MSSPNLKKFEVHATVWVQVMAENEDEAEDLATAILEGMPEVEFDRADDVYSMDVE